jgi:SPP1 family predicted phage head-tail adaptor
MDPGKRNKLITIEAKTVTKGASGGIVESWAPLAGMPTWAALRNYPGRPGMSPVAGGDAEEARTEFDLRYRPGVTAQMRVNYGGAYYNIKHVNNWQERNERLVLTCDTGVNRG